MQEKNDSHIADLAGEIAGFLADNGIGYRYCREGGVTVIRTSCGVCIIPLEIKADTPEAASNARKEVCGIVMKKRISAETASSPTGKADEPADNTMVIAEDRWRGEGECIRKRLLAHLGRFRHVFARNCEVRKISKTEADRFMDAWHSYGSTVCRYRYGLFLKKPLSNAINGTWTEGDELSAGTMVAAATFSNGRLMERDGRQYRSYQWIRYASLPDVRVAGGMGKILRHFISDMDIHPQECNQGLHNTGQDTNDADGIFGGWDIMSYADLEWSDGNVYRRLGFADEGHKSPVMYRIDPATWTRKPISRLSDDEETHNEGCMYYENFGSTRYRLIIKTR